MLLLGIDFETTGLEVEKDSITEIGAVLWDTMRKAPVEFLSAFVKRPGLVIPPEITELTGIDQELLEKHGDPDAVNRLLGLIERAHYLVSHNARAFDRPFLDYEMKRIGKSYKVSKWIDTRTDILYPKTITTRNLKYLLAEHGIINPFPHRALTDALCMMTLLAKYNLDEVILISQTPNLKIRAVVSYEDRQKAKDRSYLWEPETSIWFKLIKKHHLEEETKLCPFRIQVLQEMAP